MAHNDEQDVKMCYPTWFRINVAFCGVVTVLFTLVYIIYASKEGLSGKDIWRILFFLAVTVGGIWGCSKVVFYSVTATKWGLESKTPLRSSKFISWSEIVDFQRPRFGIPRQGVYVISDKGEKMMLMDDMKNYTELIKVIQARSPNLKRSVLAPVRK
jgi:hypothetical protein